MKQHRHEVSGDQVVINVVEHEEDLEGFRDFIRANLRWLGADTETTGLDIYSETFRLRLVQFGTPTEAWVIPAEKGGRFHEDIRMALRGLQHLVFHNASFDLQVIEQTLGIPMEELWPKTTDTQILSHLVDPRGKDEGGIGQSLEETTRFYVDAAVADGVKTLMKDLAKNYKGANSNTIWKLVDLDDPHYELYSGMDPILAARLLLKLNPLIPTYSKSLVRYEHRVAEVCAKIERRGFLLDVDYTQTLSDRLLQERDEHAAVAKSFGCENVNSTEMVADVLESRGVKINGRTPSGKRKVDKVLLESLVKTGDEFAKSVVEAKRAGKWEKTWVRAFLDKRDAGDRCHASINPLRARTARMSITGIPAQTLPSGDWMIRRCFIADEGHKMASIDYQAQELRVLAALSKDKVMIDAFKNDLDLHQLTADGADVNRKVGKMANFLTVYGGGPGALAEQAEIAVPLAKKVLAAFGKTYPQVPLLSKRLQKEAGRNGFIVTPVGRRLPVDPARAYSALNYEIQSSSRDVTCRALLRLDEAGFTPYLRLPIHDEVLASLPAEHAEWGAKEIGRLMSEQMGPVHIGTDPEVGGRSWGSMYGADY